MISAVIAIVQAKSKVTFIAQLMGISWGALSGSFFAPFFYGLYWKKVSKAAVISSFCFGCSIMIVQLFVSIGFIDFSCSFFNFVFRNSLYSGVFCMLSSLIIVPVVSLLTPKTCPANVEEMFAGYNATHMVMAKEILTDENGKQ